MARPKKETLEHRKAFDLYLSMGADRTLLEVSRRASKSEGTIKAWSLAFKWQDRIQDAEKRIADKASAKVEDSLAEVDAKLINVGKAVLGLFVKRIQGAVDAEGNLKARGYKPSALDAKIWSELMRDLMTKGSEAGSPGATKINLQAIEEMGIERFERFVLERVTRLSRVRALEDGSGGDVRVGA